MLRNQGPVSAVLPLRSLSTHKGFNEKLCYGDVTLNFTYLADGESDLSSGLIECEREGSLQEEDLKDREKEREQVLMVTRDEPSYSGMQIGEMRHNFQDTQFQNPTWCEYCKKKVWTKAASQCMTCSYVCHKKCQDKCLTEHPYCVAASNRRGADPEAKSTINRATTGLTRHIINTSSRLLNLRQVPKARLAEQVQKWDQWWWNLLRNTHLTHLTREQWHRDLCWGQSFQAATWKR